MDGMSWDEFAAAAPAPATAGASPPISLPAGVPGQSVLGDPTPVPLTFESMGHTYRLAGPNTTEVHPDDRAAFMAGAAPAWNAIGAPPGSGGPAQAPGTASGAPASAPTSTGSTAQPGTPASAGNTSSPSSAAPSPDAGMSFEDFTQPAASQTPANVPPVKTGLIANAAAGLTEAAGDVANVLSDPFGNLVGKPLVTAGLFAHDALAPVFGYDRFSDQERNALLGDAVPQPGTRLVDAVGNAMGAPLPSQVQPATDTEALVRSAVRGAGDAGMLGGGALPALAGAVGGVTGDVAARNVPAWAAPAAQMAGNLAGGSVVPGVAALGKTMAAPVSTLARPFTAAGRTQMAAQRIAGAATDLPSVRAVLAAQEPPLVPGSAPTTYQLTGDQGLGQLERAVAAPNSDRMIARSNAQNQARVDALDALAPADAAPEAVGRLFRQQLDRITGMHDALVGSLRTGAQKATDALGGAVPVGADQQHTALQQFGETMRGGLAEANAAAKAEEGRLWRAIDPDGALTVDMRPVRDAAAAITKEMPRNAAPMEGKEAAIFGTARMQKAVMPFSELAALRSRITDAMSTELRENGRTQTYGRLSKLLDAVHDAMAGRVEEKAAEDEKAVEAGQMAPEESIQDRFRDWRDGTRQQNEQAAARGGVGGGASGKSGSRTSPAAGILRAEGNPGSGPRSSPGNQSLQGGPRPIGADRQLPPRDLNTFLISRGGIKPGGDLRAMDAHVARPGLIRNSGLEHDYAREAASEAGFLPQDSTTADLYNAINEGLHGRRVYGHDQPTLLSGESSGREQALLDRARDAVLRVEEDTGQRLSPQELDHATHLAAFGVHPQEAIEDAIRSSEEHDRRVDALRQGFGPPGVAADAEQGALPGGDEPAGRPTFTPEAAGRYQRARSATAERHATFTDAPGVGQALAPGKRADEFDLEASRVPAAIFNGGKGAAERIQAFLKAGGSRPELLKALQDYAAFDLRRAAETPDGTLDPKKFTAWERAHSEALSHFPELHRDFASAAKARQTLDAAIAGRNEAIQAYEKSAASHFLGDADPVTRIGRILNSDTALPVMKDLAHLTLHEPAARAGLQRAVVEYILRDLRSNAPAGGSTLLKSDAFQTFTKKTPAALAQIFSPDQIDMMRKIAADLQRANRSISGSKLPGASNTHQDTAGAAKHGGGHASVVTQMVVAEALGNFAEHVAGSGDTLTGLAIGTAASAGALFVNMVRNAGIKKVDDLVADAMLHPALARTLLSKVPETPAAQKAIGTLIGGQIRGIAAASALAGYPRPAPEKRPVSSFATPSSAPRVSRNAP